MGRVWAGFCSIHFLWIVNPIQIQHKHMIENPNPLFKMDLQSNPNPITIQLLDKKNKRQQTLKVFCINVLMMEFP
jgi:hypothetical protein